jgi:hypothetical protein
MFYLTPGNNTCFDLDQVLKFSYFIDEEKQEIDAKTLVINFKNGYSIKLMCKTEEIAHEVFSDLCIYLNAIPKRKRKTINIKEK